MRLSYIQYTGRMYDARRQLLDRVKQDILDKNICPELAATATQLVMGDGNVDADIVFIGEAPGKNEDLQGLPFVGAAGKFLDEMLASVGLKRKDIFITNIVKYRPPENRDPTPEEKQAFWPFLARQLEIIQPNVIVTLGRHSMEFFLPDAKISQIHGQSKRLPVKMHDGTQTSWIILPLYHPAAALYNGGMRQTLLDDFSQVRTIVVKS